MLSLTKNFSDILKKTESLDWHYVVKIEQTADSHVNAISNPGFEVSTGADYSDWTEDGSGTITNETTLQHNGSQCPKITHDGANNKWVYQDITVVSNTNYILTFFTRGDGSVAGLYRIRDLNTPADIVAQVTTGVSGTDWIQVRVEFTTNNPNTSIRIFFQSPSTAGDAYFDTVHLQTASDYYYYTDKLTFDLFDLKTLAIPVYGILNNNDIPITQQLDLREHKASVGGFSIDLIDKNGDISNAWNTNPIHNRAVWLYIGIGNVSYLNDYLLLYKGVCKDWRIEGNVINLAIENNTFIVQKEIPPFLTSADAAAGQGGILPEEAQGKVKPIVIGDHVYPFMDDNRDGQDGTGSNYDRSNNLTPCVFLGLDQDGDEWWLVSKDIAYSLAAGNHNIWAYDPSLDRMVEVETYVVEQNTSSGAIISINVEPVFIDYWLPDGTNNIVETSGDGTAEANNPDNSCNLNNENACQLVVIDATNLAAIASVEIVFPEYQNSGTIETGGVKPWVKAYKATTGGTPDIDINGTNVTRTTPGLFDDYGTEADTVAGVESSVLCSVTGDQGIAGNQHELYVYMCYKTIKYKAGNRLQLFAGIEGREYSGTWNTRKTSGNLVEVAADVIESIVRDDLSITNANIDTASFDLVYTERTASHKFSGAIVDRINSKELLEDLARQNNSFVFWNADNKVKLDTFYAANTTNRTLDINEVKGLPVTYKSKLSNIVNDITLLYRENLNQSRLLSTLNRVDDRATVGSQAVYNAVMTKDIEANFIGDSTAAGLFADHWCKDDADSFWSVLHDVVEVQVACNRGVDYWVSGVFKPTFLLELGDIIELDDTDFDSFIKCNGQSWSGIQFKIFYIQRMKQGLFIKGFSV